jgi:hypothetical protein
VKEGEGSRLMLLGNRTSGSPGLLYLVQDQAFVSNAAPAVSNAARILAKMQESVKVRWKRFSKLHGARALEARKTPNAP